MHVSKNVLAIFSIIQFSWKDCNFISANQNENCCYDENLFESCFLFRQYVDAHPNRHKKKTISDNAIEPVGCERHTFRFDIDMWPFEIQLVSLVLMSFVWAIRLRGKLKIAHTALTTPDNIYKFCMWSELTLRNIYDMTIIVECIHVCNE